MITNVVGLVAAVLGDKILWWIDPVGAVILAIYTIVNWSKTVLENAGTSKTLHILPMNFCSVVYSPHLGTLR